MRILLTGATGFIGSHLAEALSKRPDVELYGLVRWRSGGAELPRTFTPVYGDLTDYPRIISLIKRLTPELVIHLAAITPVSESFDKPLEYLETNLLGTVNLAEACRQYSPYLRKFIYGGTPEEYGIQPRQPVKEDARLNPVSPYALSKASASQYLLYMYEAYGFPAVISRHSNAYGRKDQRHFVVESIVTQMLEKDEVVLEDPKPIRDFLHIDDVVQAYLKLIEKGSPGEVYNFGWGEGYSIEEVARMAKLETGFRGRIRWGASNRPIDPPEIILDSTKARRELGWEPRVPLEEGLRKTVEYWRSA